MNSNKRKILGTDNSVANELNVKKPKIIENDAENSFVMELMFDSDNDFEVQIPVLDLTKWQRCLVESIEIINRNEKQVNLVNKSSNERGTCIVQGIWIGLDLKPGDVVSILAAWDETRNKFVCTAEKGLIIYSPDFLISGTSVVGALFCLRKGVLADRFKGFDSGNKIMTIGSLVHELFQTVIRKNVHTLKEVNAECEALLHSQDTTYQLFATQLPFAEICEEISKYIPNIMKFMTKYIKNKRSLSDTSNADSKLDEILDIEENIWLPNLGLKGKIDVTVKTKSGTIMPLEIKTGRPSFSLEHKGQVGLYQMMLKELGKNVPSGLLLYLKDDILKEITLRHNEKRDLIMLRNELAYYLNQNIEFIEPSSKFKVPTLPEPINHHSGCGKCPYNIICATYLKRDTNIRLSDSHPLKILSEVVLSHLTQNDIDYFVHWSGIISLENETIRRETPLKNIWLKSTEKRQVDGTAIANLKLTGKVTEIESSYLHIFSNQDLHDKENVAKSYDLTKSSVNVGDYVMVSVPNRVAIATGHVKSLSKHFVTILLERDLTKHYKNLPFIVDKYVSELSLAINFTNLGALLDDTEGANRLRRIIVEKEKSKFDKTIPREIALKAEGILRALNHIQRKAVLKSIAAQDYILIKGLPGTGKTQTLVALIQIFVILGKSVVITSHTNSAVDNVLLRLKSVNLSFLRLGSISKIHQDLHEYSENHILESCKSPEELQKSYDHYQVFGVTCYGASHILLSQRKFDVCIVDESTQVFQMTVFRPLLCARKFVLVGDPDQLPPIIKSSQAKSLGADESLFSRLDSEEFTVTLTHQYRMNKCITNLANRLTYKGGLVCANDELAKSTFVVPNTELIMNNYASEKWLLKSLSTHIDQSVIVLDTDNVFEKSLEFQEQQNNDVSIIGDGNVSFVENHKHRGTIYVNYCEAAVIVYLIDSLVKAGVSLSSIGIIAPYRAQVALLKLAMAHYDEYSCENDTSQLNKAKIEVNTVDQYQGRDKQIIIYSCTKSNNKNYKPDAQQAERKLDGEILEDHRRLTVAVTRAKHKLIIIGDLETLHNYTPFRSLFNCIGNVSKTKFVDGKMGFSWQAILHHFDNILNKETNIENLSQTPA